MIKIYVSSTFRDLKEIRSEILDKLDSVFESVGIEKFFDPKQFPDGMSQDVWEFPNKFNLRLNKKG